MAIVNQQQLHLSPLTSSISTHKPQLKSKTEHKICDCICKKCVCPVSVTRNLLLLLLLLSISNLDYC